MEELERWLSLEEIAKYIAAKVLMPINKGGGNYASR